MTNYLAISVGGWVGIGIGGLVVLLIIIGICWAVGCFNQLIRLRNNNEEAFSTMDVYLKKRYDLIPNLVETVKGYAKHEKDALQAVISARNQAQSAITPADKAMAEKAFSGSIRTMMAVAENYPDLKANANFMDLQNQLKNIETEIANARRYYNACVKTYNTKCQIFPSSIIANAKGFEKAPPFEVADIEERNNVKVQF